VETAEARVAASAGGSRRRPLSWRGLVLLAAAGHLAVLAVQVAVQRDREAAALALVLLAGMALLRLRSGLLGLLALGAVFLNTQIWMFPAATANASHKAGLVSLLIPASLLVCSLAGLIGVVAAIARLHDPGAGRGVAGPAGAIAAVFVLADLALVPLMTPAPPERVPPGALLVQARNLAYSPTSLAARPGRVTVALRNRDLFWHTLTIRSLGVDLTTPVSSVRSVSFQARPGVYRFYCRVPTHAAAGMHGTLTVR
jgi:plastocyanin